MSSEQWHGLVATVLAISVGGGFLLIAVEELRHAGHIQPEEATIFATLGGAAIGALATYLGGVTSRRKRGGTNGNSKKPDEGADA